MCQGARQGAKVPDKVPRLESVKQGARVPPYFLKRAIYFAFSGRIRPPWLPLPERGHFKGLASDLKRSLLYGYTVPVEHRGTFRGTFPWNITTLFRGGENWITLTILLRLMNHS